MSAAPRMAERMALADVVAAPAPTPPPPADDRWTALERQAAAIGRAAMTIAEQAGALAAQVRAERARDGKATKGAPRTTPPRPKREPDTFDD